MSETDQTSQEHTEGGQAGRRKTGTEQNAGPERSISYFSLTAGGTLLALKLRDRFGGNAHLPRCYSLGCKRCDPFDSIAEALPESFRAGETLVCVMAAGIVFRVLAPHLRSKQEDAGVIVIDESGRHVIPLLGGHAAGANSLAREIAGFLGAAAAITTASDVHGLTAPDQLAEQIGAAVDDPVALRRVTALLVDGRPVCIEAPADPGVDGYGWIPPGGSTQGYAGRVLVDYFNDFKSKKDFGGASAELQDDGALLTARLIPRRLATGVGCRRGTPAEEIVAAVRQVCAAARIDSRALAVMASVAAKEDEPGLSQAATQLGLRLVFYQSESLADLGRPGSDFVARQVGTPAVCEPAALMAAGADGGRDAFLLAEKTAVGAVTVALAAPAELMPDARKQTTASVVRPPRPGSSGEILVVGTGAGTEALLTAEAAQAIESADIVLGYRTYIEQLRPLFPDKELRSGAMGAEMQRCLEAVELARAGRRVAMVSSGDAGIYGMAGLVLEVAGDVPVAVVPGVTAAQIAAARLGAPLMNDFITLSLSDLLTPRKEVIRRARLAAESGLVICLYNPASRKRRPLYEEVCAILAASRGAATPAGWVRDAGGPEEVIRMTTVGALAAEPVDMRTLVIVGNSHTRLIGGRMVTSRGYENKGRDRDRESHPRDREGLPRDRESHPRGREGRSGKRQGCSPDRGLQT